MATRTKTHPHKAKRATRKVSRPDRVKKVRAQPQPERPYVTLGELVETLGSDVLRVLVAPKGLEVRVTETTINDPIDPAHIEPGDIVLAVGTSTQERTALELINIASASGASAVVFKVREESGALEAAASAAGVALIGTDPEMVWTQLYGLLKTAIATAGEITEGGVAGTPVGDLFALANAVAAMVGGPSTIEDPQSRVLAYSSLDEPIDEPRRQTILGRRVPEPWIKRLHEHGVFRKLWTTDGVITVELPFKGLRRRLAIAVRAGGEILGSIWVAEGRKPLGKPAEEALREAAKIASLHLIRHRTSEDLERRRRGELLSSLLEGSGPIEHTATRLGIEADQAFTVMAFEIVGVGETEVALQRDRVRELASLHSETFHRRAACVSIDKTIYSLLPTPNALEQGRLAALAGRVVSQAESSLRTEVRAAIGSTVGRLRDAPQSRVEADRVLRVLSQDSGKGVATIDDVRADAILLELRDLGVERPHLRSGKVQTLLDHDAKHGTSYIESLRAYLDAFGDITRAASSIKVHPNTFRYRVRRLMELSAIDLANPNERLVTELQLRLL